MKTLIKALGFVSLLSAAPLMAVDTTRATQADASLENGLEKVKAGTQEAAKGVTAAAEEASKNAAEVGKKMGRSIKSATCPVVGDRKSKLYYAADSKSYLQVLDGQKYFEDDDRSCFRTEDAARAEGYTRSAN